MNISEVEKNILESLDSKYKWIARDKNGDLNLYETKPTKSVRTGYWASDNYKSVDIFPGLFLDITWEDKEPYRIFNLVNDIGVIEDNNG